MLKILCSSILIFNLTASYSQTCCSGGVPLSGNIGLPASNPGTFQLSLSYDNNVLNTLKSGSETLDESQNERRTQSALLELGYTFSPRLSVDIFMSFVQQERHIFSPFGINSTITKGVGDGVILVKYKLSKPLDNYTWEIGAGPKLPLGTTEKKSDLGITLAADLQPGSGAWDAVFWTNFNKQLSFRPSMTINLMSTFRLTGDNKDFLGSLTYGFGNEYQTVASISDRLVIQTLMLDPSISLRYRWAGRDSRDNQEIEATGGQWVFIIPGLNVNLIRGLAVSASVELPIYSYVNNTQLTPTKRLVFGVFIVLNKREKL